MGVVQGACEDHDDPCHSLRVSATDREALPAITSRAGGALMAIQGD